MTAEDILRQEKYSSLKNLVLICEAMEEYKNQSQPEKEQEKILKSVLQREAENNRLFQQEIERLKAQYNDYVQYHIDVKEEKNKKIYALADKLAELEAQLKGLTEWMVNYREDLKRSNVYHQNQGIINSINKALESSPTEQPEGITLLSNEEFNSQVNQNRDNAIIGYKKPEQQNQPQPEKVDDVQWQDIMTTAAGIEPQEEQGELRKAFEAGEAFQRYYQNRYDNGKWAPDFEQWIKPRKHHD